MCDDRANANSDFLQLLHVWGQYHSSEVSCEEWYWNPSPDISGYMCGARRVVRGLLLTTVRINSN